LGWGSQVCVFGGSTLNESRGRAGWGISLIGTFGTPDAGGFPRWSHFAERIQPKGIDCASMSIDSGKAVPEGPVWAQQREVFGAPDVGRLLTIAGWCETSNSLALSFGIKTRMKIWILVFARNFALATVFAPRGGCLLPLWDR